VEVCKGCGSVIWVVRVGWLSGRLGGRVAVWKGFAVGALGASDGDTIDFAYGDSG